MISLLAIANTSHAGNNVNQLNDLANQKNILYKNCELKIKQAYKMYPAKDDIYAGSPPKKLTFIGNANKFSTKTKLVSTFKPEVANKYAINAFGCGTDCLGSIIIDLNSGDTFLEPIYSSAIETNLQSNVIVTDHEPLKDYLSNHWAKPVNVWLVKNKHVEKLFSCRLNALNEH